jgi:hypothetical protein
VNKLYSYVKELWNAAPDTETNEIARQVLKTAMQLDDPENFLFPAIHAFVITARRDVTRTLHERPSNPFSNPLLESERNEDGNLVKDYPEPLPQYVKPGSDDDPAVAALRALLHDTLYVPGKRRVRVELMTLDDWAARRDHLQARIKGYELSVSTCDDAIAVLEESGAENLKQYYEANPF